ncbi:hypothetical protein [Bartonella quintana]|nr:hypothetical protein [Bartonella quintana]
MNEINVKQLQKRLNLTLNEMAVRLGQYGIGKNMVFLQERQLLVF